MCLHCDIPTKKSRHSVVRMLSQRKRKGGRDESGLASNLIISTFLPRANIDKVEQALALVETMREMNDIGSGLHLLVLDTRTMQAFDVRIGSNLDRSVCWINTQGRQVIFDSVVQLVRGISTSSCALIQEPVSKLTR